MRRCVVAGAAALCLALQVRADEPLSPRFVEETAASGITTAYDGEWEFMVGGGVATFDCSGDGKPEVFVAGGAGMAALYRNNSALAGALRFAPVASGLELESVTGAYPLDIDADGLTDLVLLRVGEDIVMRGEGDCRFARANEAWGFEGGDAWSTAFAATWEAGAAWPTLAIGTYIDRAEEAFPWGSCTDTHLFRPGGRGFAPPLPLAPGFCALSMLFTDWNRSGTPALRISNDREYYKGGREQLWRIEPGKAPVEFTEAEGWKTLRIWGMGIASADLDTDGFPEYFLTSMADNKLQRLTPPALQAGRPTYGDVAFKLGVTAHRPYTGSETRPSTAWHAQFDDVNNDGRADLFVAKGNVAEMPDFAQDDPNNLLVQRSDGTFAEMGDVAGVASMAISRGGQLVDLNLDGLLDLVVVNRWQGAQVWRNVTEGAGGWVQLRLAQEGANRDAIGAWIEVRDGDRVQRREITAGGGHASGHLGWRHFGVGQATTVEVRVLWPNAEAGDWQPVASDTFQTLSPGRAPIVWQP